jgi:phage gpG-like protein
MKPAFTYKGRPYTFAQVHRHWLKNKNRLMPVLGQVAVNFFQDRFRAQAWTDRFAKRWQPRKPPDKKGRGRAILVKSGALRNSIHVKTWNRNQVIVSAPKSYAAAHNEGFKGTINIPEHTRRIRGRVAVYSLKTRRKSTRRVTLGVTTVRAHSRKMNLPQRQFMGNSETLSRRFDRLFIKDIDKSFDQ